MADVGDEVAAYRLDAAGLGEVLDQQQDEPGAERGDPGGDGEGLAAAGAAARQIQLDLAYLAVPRVSRAICSIGSTASLPPRTSPRAYAAELALTTASASSRTTAEERSTDSTVSTPGGSTASVCSEVRVGLAWSRSLQRNASMAMTPVHNPAIAATAATAAFTFMHSRLCARIEHFHSRAGLSRTLVAQSSPWGRRRFTSDASATARRTGWRGATLPRVHLDVRGGSTVGHSQPDAFRARTWQGGAHESSDRSVSESQ